MRILHIYVTFFNFLKIIPLTYFFNVAILTTTQNKLCSLYLVWAVLNLGILIGNVYGWNRIISSALTSLATR